MRRSERGSQGSALRFERKWPWLDFDVSPDGRTHCELAFELDTFSDKPAVDVEARVSVTTWRGEGGLDEEG
jgi:hypothetical protein